ncbi:MAG: NAD(P)-dependent oxidoreductase [Candidatus Coatesbacteria bacterium]
MKVAVTGGTGFIGSHVVKELSQAGHTVTVMARNPAKAPGLRALNRVRIARAEMHDLPALARNLTGQHALVHIALCWGNTAPLMMEAETLASIRLIDLAVAKGVKQVLYTSSTAAAGYSYKTITEDKFPLPEDFYGATKVSVEMFCLAWGHRRPDIRFNVIRPGYTFGDACVRGGSTGGDRRFTDICAKIKAGKPIKLSAGEGTQFVWAGDLAKLYRAVLESRCRNEVFYGLGRRYITWEQIARWAREIHGSRSPIRAVGKRGTPHLFSLRKIEKAFGLKFDGAAKMKEHIRTLLA